jgi:hypothetical protein
VYLISRRKGRRVVLFEDQRYIFFEGSSVKRGIFTTYSAPNSLNHPFRAVLDTLLSNWGIYSFFWFFSVLLLHKALRERVGGPIFFAERVPFPSP